MKLILTAFLIILGVNAMANVELDGECMYFTQSHVR